MSVPIRTILLASSLTTAIACDPISTGGQQARPDRTAAATTSRGARPAVTESALSSTCDPDHYQCIGSDTLEYCDYDGYAAESCTAICQSYGFAASAGCGFDTYYAGDACFCDDAISSPAPSCAPGWTCAGDDLDYCDGEVIESWSCDAVCRDAGYDFALACDYDDYGEASCFCDYDDVYGASCALGEESCGDGTCVPEHYICDGYQDCASGADEYGCAQCSFSGGVCNGDNQVDVCDPMGGVVSYDCDAVCRDGGYDYSEGCHYDSPETGDSCFCGDYELCRADELTCGDGSCVPLDYVCDGYQDCADLADEAGCATECAPGEAYCSTDFVLEYCNDYGFWETWSCDDVCQGAGYSYADYCGYDSFSGDEGCFCAD